MIDQKLPDKSTHATSRFTWLDDCWWCCWNIRGISNCVNSSRSKNSSHGASLEPAGTRVRLSGCYLGRRDVTMTHHHDVTWVIHALLECWGCWGCT